MKLSSLLVSISSSLLVVGTPALAPIHVPTSATCVPKHADDDSCFTTQEWDAKTDDSQFFIKELETYRSEVKRLCYGVVDSTIYPLLAPASKGQVNETTLRLEYEPKGAYFLDQEIHNRCTLQ
jgi:hypothetical protein